MDQTLEAKIRSILEEAKDMTIATIREDGFPQATTVTFVNDGLKLYFGCEADAQKAANIARNSKVSIAVTPHYEDWSDIRGLSMGALAEPVTDAAEAQKVEQLMAGKYPQVVDILPEELDAMTLIRVTPKVISVLDYSQGFGHTDLVTL
ncbi:MAG TPA: pyridoxamine 5'-phosphate oxidase family protein [Kiloniellaceae bacterium]|nr:pyridoxamine 5'-phosphate oxidase family protein [Kiloniellaceae bacterium]